MTNQYEIFQYLLLERSIDGCNSISNIKMTAQEIQLARLENGHEIENFQEFLVNSNSDRTEILLELSQVLKVPFKDLILLKEYSVKKRGYITKRSKENILSYFNVRACPRMIDFLSCQEGKAGSRNCPKA